MTGTKQDEARPTGLLAGLKASPATHQLADQARGLAQAHAERLTGSLTKKLGSAGEKLGDIAESGKLPMVGEGAKRMLQGDSGPKAAAGAVGKGIADKAKSAFQKLTGKKGKGSGRAKAMDIEESIDVGVPVSVAYDQWSQFQDFSRFMKGVESVEQASETETNWRAKVFKSRRSWKATIQEQIPDHRIVWTSEGAKGSTKGVVTFHPLGEDLTKVLLSMEYYPHGVMEKTGNIWRAAGRRARLDLKNYRRFVMGEGEATGSWRGEIRDGEVVKQPEENEQEQQDGKGAKGESQDGNGRRKAQAGSGDGDGGNGRARSAAKKQGGKPARSEQAGRAPAKKASSGRQPRKESGRSTSSGSRGGGRAAR